MLDHTSIVSGYSILADTFSTLTIGQANSILTFNIECDWIYCPDAKGLSTVIKNKYYVLYRDKLSICQVCVGSFWQ